MSLLFNNLIDDLNIPDSCKLDKPIYKKMFNEKGVLSSPDKLALKEDVGKIRWLYTLKPSTINIAPFHDNDREYPEISILHIPLKSPKRVKRIANFVNRSIPYPLVLLFTAIQEGKDFVLIELSPKRINQADKDKWVIEDTISTAWIELDQIKENSILQAFKESLCIEQLPISNFFTLYNGFCECVTALNCSEFTGQFRLEEQDGSGRRKQALKDIQKLGAEKKEIANKLKTEKNMGKRVELNTKIRAITEKLKALSKSL